MVVARNVRLVRVCFQLRNPPRNKGRTDSTMRLADMHTTIHPSFCQAGIASKNERNSSKLMPPNYATPQIPPHEVHHRSQRQPSILHAPHGILGCARIVGSDSQAVLNAAYEQRVLLRWCRAEYHCNRRR